MPTAFALSLSLSVTRPVSVTLGAYGASILMPWLLVWRSSNTLVLINVVTLEFLG